MFTPPGSFDTEQNGQIFNKSWRINEREEQTSLLLMEKSVRKTSITAKDIP